MDQSNPYIFSKLSNPDHWLISEIILTQCSMYPERKIISFIDGFEWTFNDLKIKSLEKAHILKKLDIKPGDTLTVMIDDPKEFIPYWIASSFLGVMFVALNTALKGSVLLHQISISKSNYVIVDEAYFNEVSNLIEVSELNTKTLNCLKLFSDELMDENDIYIGKPSDDVCTMFTSGTSVKFHL